MLRKSAFYLVAVLFIFSGQFLVSSGLVTGTPPTIDRLMLDGKEPMSSIVHGPGLIYIWAEWCGVCRTMQDNVDAVLRDYPGVTIAVRSDDQHQLANYLLTHQLNWPVVDDSDGRIGERFGIRGVPALFFLNRQGNIVFTSVGYTSELGLRFRLWLAELI